MALAYPIARGLAPVLVLLGAAVATAVRPSPLEVVGVLAVAAGVLLVRGAVKRGDFRSTAMAVGVAATIACYTVIDKSGLHHAATIPYFEVVLATQGIAYAAALSVARGAGVVVTGFSRWSAAVGWHATGSRTDPGAVDGIVPLSISPRQRLAEVISTIDVLAATPEPRSLPRRSNRYPRKMVSSPKPAPTIIVNTIPGSAARFPIR